MARDINPEVEIVPFPEGVNADNVSAFLDGADLFLDGLDFFAFAIREIVSDACANPRIPATTVAPIGMGASLLNFMPREMGFDDISDSPAMPR